VKAQAARTRMYVSEESDSGIVTDDDHSNKIEQSMAESEEGRAADQGEHPSVQHAPDTERDTRVNRGWRVCGKRVF